MIIATGVRASAEAAVGLRSDGVRVAYSDKVGCLYADWRPSTETRSSDADIWHGVRNATHKIDMDEDLTMLPGPARNGAPLELGVLGLDGDDPVVIHALPLRAKFYRFLG